MNVNKMDDKVTFIQFGNSQLVTNDSEFKKFKVSKGFLSDERKRNKLKRARGKAVEIKKCVDSKRLHIEADILNMIAPPREWTENRKHWRQMVSSVPATTTDVLELKRKMELFLKTGRAHKTGLCNVRRRIMSQVFDELIRHVTVNCAERGLLLIHVRDDLKQTRKHFQRLYTSAVAYGIRKTLKSLMDQSDLMKKIEKERLEVEEEKKQHDEMVPYYNRFAAQFVKSCEEEDKEYNEELEKLLKKKQALKVLVEKSVGPRPTPKDKTKLLEKLDTIKTTTTTTVTNEIDIKSRKSSKFVRKPSSEEQENPEAEAEEEISAA